MGSVFWLHLVILIPILIATAFCGHVIIPTEPNNPDNPMYRFIGYCIGVFDVLLSVALADICVCCVRNRKGK